QECYQGKYDLSRSVKLCGVRSLSQVVLIKQVPSCSYPLSRGSDKILTYKRVWSAAWMDVGDQFMPASMRRLWTHATVGSGVSPSQANPTSSRLNAVGTL